MIVSVIFSGALSGYICSLKIRKNGLTVGLLSTVIPIFILLITMAIANNGFNIFMIIPCAIMLVFGATGGVLAVNTKHKTKKK